jgi:CubicO group peptidase (beta-lactamase class C family)
MELFCGQATINYIVGRRVRVMITVLRVVQRASFCGALLCCTLAWLAPLGQAGAASGQHERMTDAQIVQDLESKLDELVRSDRFSGAVLLAKGDQILFEQAYGFANHAFDARNRVDTKFNLGSMNKMFTGVAILQLMQQGTVAPEDTISKVLPDYPNKEVGAKVTVEQLLTHTSGIADFFSKEFLDTNFGKYRKLSDFLPVFADKPLRFEPGSRYSYNNAEYIVLGLMIERLSGESYYGYVREHIFKPAGMINTDSYAVDEDIPNLALGYTRTLPDGSELPEDAPRHTNLFVTLAKGVSAGGGYSTVEDLFRFSRAVLTNKLLDQAHTNILLTGKVPTRPNTKYGYGMEEQFVNGVRIVGHNGGNPGIMSWLDMFPDLGYTAVVMSNYDNAAAPVVRRLEVALTGQERPAAVHLAPDVLRSYEGDYAVPGRPPLKLSADADGLWLQLGPSGKHRLLPVSTNEFFDDESPMVRHHFAKDKQGRVTMTVTGLGPQPLTATRTH